MSPADLPAQARVVAELSELLVQLAARAAKSAAQSGRPRRSARGYAALRPGPSTPLWNELASACARELNRRGDKARLARIIGVPRQRVHVLLVARTACPNAERTLQLLAWLHARRRGAEPL